MLDMEQTPYRAYDGTDNGVTVEKVEQRSLHIEAMNVNGKDDSGEEIDQNQHCHQTCRQSHAHQEVPCPQAVILLQRQDIAQKCGGNCHLHEIEDGQTDHRGPAQSGTLVHDHLRGDDVKQDICDADTEEQREDAVVDASRGRLTFEMTEDQKRYRQSDVQEVQIVL